jgi:hypothetical protein
MCLVLVWAVVGGAAALSVVSSGPLLGLPVALVAFLLARKASIRESAFGVVSGVGLLLLAVGWINRTGESLDPRPWWALGSAFLVAGVAAHAVRERR